MKSLELESSYKFAVWELFITTSSVLALVTCWMHLRSANVSLARAELEMQKSPWAGDLRSLSGILGWSCWCLGKTCFLHNFCTVSSHSVFSDTFFRWLEIPRGSSGFDSQGDFFYLPRHGNGNSHSSNRWVFPLSSLVFVGFFKWFVEIVLLRLSGSKPSRPERTYELTGSSEIALTKVQDDIMCHLRRMQERFEWILNIFWRLILKDVVIQWLKRWNNASSTVIIRQNHRGAFSDPSLSSGCSCVKPTLTGSVVQCGIRCRFHQQKRVVFRLRIVLPNTIIARLGTFFHCSHCFACFSHFSDRPTSWSSPCFDVFLTPKGVQQQLDGWPWNGEGVLGAKGCVGTKHFFLQLRQS